MTGHHLVLSSKWHDPASRRREAVRAAHDQDEGTLADLLEHYLRLKSRSRGDVSPETVRKYVQGLRHFLSFCGPDRPGASPRLELTRLGADDVDLWLAWLADKGLKPNAIALYLNAVRALYRALEWAGAAKENPAAQVKPVRDPTPAHMKKPALSPALYRDLLALPLESHEDDLVRANRDTLLLALGGSAGLRSMEVCALDVDDLQLAMGQLVVRQGKGRKRRSVPISRQLSGLCRHWLVSRKALEARGDIRPDERALLVALD
ncbi:MAG TPA: tyrosine-type recombinase/integrase, partial [Deinococcales bacterium]|nr:tyrosine-type recombinase/integrase [Deinococcales bacterium]